MDAWTRSRRPGERRAAPESEANVPDAANDVTLASGRRSWRTTLVTVWAALLTLLLGLLFTGMTALTLSLWATDPAYTQTNPVVDLAFFALGGILVTTGLASQVRGGHVAGLQQAVLALLALSAAGWLGARIEPFVGPLLLLVAAAPLIVLHPRRRQLLAPGDGVSGPLMVLALTAAVPAAVYAAGMLAQARVAGPSCFLGQCVRGDRLAEAAALAIAVVLVALLAALRTPGWPVPVWCAGLAALVLGAISWAFPEAPGALAPWAAAATVLWGVAFVVVGAHEQRPLTRSRMREGIWPRRRSHRGMRG